jgi:hypothetical protein
MVISVEIGNWLLYKNLNRNELDNILFIRVVCNVI